MKRIPQLDVLRAIAVLLVIGNHVTWSPVLVRFGWTGVDLFFCLSGFLVSGLLFRDYRRFGTLHWKRFLIRRGFKIYPAYYTLILTTIILDRFVREPGWPSARWGRLWPDLIFVQNYRAGTWGHLWSLGVEEQFYLLLPLLLLILARKNSRDPFAPLPWICAFVAVTCLTLRAMTFHEITALDHFRFMWPFHLRCDSLFFGVLLSYLNEFRPEVLQRFLVDGGRPLLTVSLACILPALAFDQQSAFLYVPGLTLLYLGFGGILTYSLACTPRTGPIMRILSRIGQASYSIYLWHFLVAWSSVSVLQNHLHWGRNSVFAVYVMASLALGMGMARLIEYPALKLREKFFPESSKGARLDPAIEVPREPVFAAGSSLSGEPRRSRPAEIRADARVRADAGGLASAARLSPPAALE